MLSNIRIVLVQTFHPGNIGATARAMKTMGLTELVLVNPRTFPAEEATRLAAG
ncbi:MAG TPA: RNA methyltransferase, partial [Halomonas sp.]|nr:RNA methyltransferase [Halomonas sp.]